MQEKRQCQELTKQLEHIGLELKRFFYTVFYLVLLTRFAHTPLRIIVYAFRLLK